MSERFRFLSEHTGHESLTGRTCTVITAYDESFLWPFAVRFDGDGTTSVAVHRQLSPIAEDGSVGEPLVPPKGSRKGWDTFAKMTPKWIVTSDGMFVPAMQEPENAA
ncbi:MAG: hypothetical protein V4529_16805 [Gemmatimonadota bacterium]